MCLDLLDGLGFGAWTGSCCNVGLAVRVHELHRARDVFMVHYQQRAVIAGDVRGSSSAQAKEVHAVVVVARTAGKVAVGAIILVVAHCSVNRVAGGVDDSSCVSGWHGDAVGGGLVDGREVQKRAGRCIGSRTVAAPTAAGTQAQGAQACHGHRAHTAL